MSWWSFFSSLHRPVSAWKSCTRKVSWRSSSNNSRHFLASVSGQWPSMAAANFSPPLSIIVFALLVHSRLAPMSNSEDLWAKLHPGFTSLTDNNAHLVRSAALVDFNSSKLSAILDQRPNSSHCLLLICLLVLCGDIQVNPGPSKCQCGLCNKVVRSNQDAIECEQCLVWYHLNCLGMSTQTYENHGLESHLVWICSKCMFSNFSTSFFTNNNISNFNSKNTFASLDSTPTCSQDSAADAFKPHMTSSPKIDHVTPTPLKDEVDRLKIFSININSIPGKLNNLQGFIDVQHPDIIAIQETKIDPGVTTAELFPRELGFSIFRKDRSLRGWGVLLAIKSALCPTPCPDLENFASESVWAKIFLKGQPHYFCSFYRPPQQHIDEIQSLSEQLDLINRLHPPANQPGVHIFGDLNFGKIDWITRLNTDGKQTL